MSSLVGDVMGAVEGQQGQGFMGKVEDTAGDATANNFINKEMGTLETDAGLSNTGMEGTAEKAADAFIDKEADTELNKFI